MKGRSSSLSERRIGRCALVAILGLSQVCSFAAAQNATDASALDGSVGYRHIIRSAPAPKGSLRQDNISDEEVREVQAAALAVYPDSIVLISGVTDGCNCEEGRSCTAQVWLALSRASQTRGLVLSRIDGHWMVGAVQSWWLQYDAHQRIAHGIASPAKWHTWQLEEQRLLDNFPACPAPHGEWVPVRSDSDRTIYADRSSMQVSGDIRRVNFKSVFTPNKHSHPWIEFTIDSMAFDCKEHRQQSGGTDTYYSDRTAWKYPASDSVLWYPVRPGMATEADLHLVCGWSGG